MVEKAAKVQEESKDEWSVVHVKSLSVEAQITAKFVEGLSQHVQKPAPVGSFVHKRKSGNVQWFAPISSHLGLADREWREGEFVKPKKDGKASVASGCLNS